PKNTANTMIWFEIIETKNSRIAVNEIYPRKPAVFAPHSMLPPSTLRVPLSRKVGAIAYCFASNRPHSVAFGEPPLPHFVG
ncbi:MAG: hypothetical protein M3Y78_13110, partial [Pseudomonadota bacterium]|nr:hypothetical protein [Pseudomonadota bacterium]